MSLFRGGTLRPTFSLPGRVQRLLCASPAAICRSLQGEDISNEYARQLLEPGLERPPPLDGLRDFLEKPPACKIPITADALSLLPSFLEEHFTVASGQLARAVGAGVGAPLITGATEQWTVITENTVVVTPLLTLDAVLPPNLRMG